MPAERIDLLARLSEAFGPSGFEDEVRELIKNEMVKLVDDIKVDKLGNLICTRYGEGKTFLLDAHMDEVGLMASTADREGTVRFSQIGQLRPYSLPGTPVRFRNGIVGTIEWEKQRKGEGAVSLKELFVDIGATSREEAEKALPAGTPGVFDIRARIRGDIIYAKSLDDRAGCYVLIGVARKLKGVPLRGTVVFVFSTQEEVGLRGARVAAYGIDADEAIAVDVTATGDYPEIKDIAVKLGKGVAIKFMDAWHIAHPSVRDRLIAVAEANNIPYQREVLPFGTTDGAVVQLSKTGIPTATVSIPTRHIHSPVQIANIRDIENCVELIEAYVAEGS